jgi:hypothetical protein
MTCRLTHLFFDEDEELSRVVLFVDQPTGSYLETLLPAVELFGAWIVGDGGEIALTLDEARTVLRACGQVRSSDPEHEVSTPVWHSLIWGAERFFPENQL